MTAPGTILVEGREHPCAVPVVPWLKSGMHFTPLRTRTQPTRWCIVHWTASENSALQVFTSMKNHRNRKTGALEPLSVHFIVDQLGEAYQTADCGVRAAHAAANGGNTYGVGIEICNRGHDPKLPHKGFRRSLRTEMVNGERITYGEFFYAQVQTVIALCHAVCNAYGLPVDVPRGPDGDVLDRTMTTDELEDFRGVIGHYMVEPGKVDPALDLLRKIAASTVPRS